MSPLFEHLPHRGRTPSHCETAVLALVNPKTVWRGGGSRDSSSAELGFKLPTDLGLSLPASWRRVSYARVNGAASDSIEHLAFLRTLTGLVDQLALARSLLRALLLGRTALGRRIGQEPG